MRMRSIYVTLFFAVSHSSAAMPLVGTKLRLEIPPIWDQGARTFYTPKHIPLLSMETNEICAFRGGIVTIKKIEPTRVILEYAGGMQSCKSLWTSAENIARWDPNEVQAQKQKYSALSEAFRAQLDSDVQNVLQEKYVCNSLGADLSVGEKYRIEGNVIWYGPSSEARKVNAKGEVVESCHVEKNGTIKVLGFDRSQTFAIAEYQAPPESSGNVQTSSRTHSNACKSGESVVLLANKVNSQFGYAAENPNRELVEKVAALFNVGITYKSMPKCDRASDTTARMITGMSGSVKTPPHSNEDGKSDNYTEAETAE